MEEDVGGTVAHGLGDVEVHLRGHPVEKLVNGSIVVAFEHEGSRVGLDKDDPSFSMGRYLQRLDGDWVVEEVH